MSGYSTPRAYQPELSAFGENVSIQPKPKFMLSFPYNINSLEVETRPNASGTVTNVTGHARVASGAAANSAAYMRSRRLLRYEPGRGGLIRFAGCFTTGASNSQQFAGYGGVSDGFFFGYQGSSFGVCRRYGGVRETRTLTITTASSTAENVTVTLDGQTKLVAVTASGVKSTTANEIAAGDYSSVGAGWSAEANGETVIFMSWNTAAHGGAYSVAGTTIVGSFAQTLAAVAATDSFVAQSSWNIDKANGTGVLPNIDFTKGNVYQIRFQWLGHGDIEFSMEDPVTGHYFVVHRIQYANSSTATSISNPSLPFFMEAINASNASNVFIDISSAGGYVEGQGDGIDLERGAVVTKTGITTEVPVFSLKNASIYSSKRNRAPIRPHYFAVATDGTKNALFKVYKNVTLTSPTWTAIDVNTSPSYTDSAATAFSGGQTLSGKALAKIDNGVIDFDPIELYLFPGESITITAQSAASTDVSIGASWCEEL